MFIRVKTKAPNKFAIQLVESVRDGNKVKQRIVRHVGMATNEGEVKKLVELGEWLKTQIEEEHQPSLFGPEVSHQMALEARSKQHDETELTVDLKKLREEARHIIGIHDVYGQVYRQLRFDSILGWPARNQHAHDLIQHLVMARIANPTSKLKSVLNLEEDFGIHLDLDRVYKTLDKINDKVIEGIQDRAYQATKALLGGKVDVLFYDCTTLYFESFKSDGFRENGYSKDMKFNQPQLVLALLVSKEGLPVGYEVFPGNCYEGHTLLPVLKQLKTRYLLDKVVFVADSGLLNVDNLTFLQENGFGYIVGARLKNMGQKVQHQLLDLASYQPLKDRTDCSLKVIELDEPNRLILNHSQTRATKDRHDRNEALEKLKKKLKKSKNPADLISNYGYKKYLTITGESVVGLNEEKLIADSQWDGLQGLISNIYWMEPEEMISHYKGLWQIEESFRISKHDLKVRPIYHYCERRIKAHLAICFMAFTCIRYLEYRVKVQYQKLSPEVIRRELCHVQVSLLRHNQTRDLYAFPSKMTEVAAKIYKIIGSKAHTTPYKI